MNGRHVVQESIVVPCFNEAGRLPGTLPRLLEFCNAETELVIVDDGSTDSTAEIIARAAEHCEFVRPVLLKKNVGKGGALRAGVDVARGRRIIFMDADLATDLGAMDQARDLLASNDIVIGSRATVGATMHQTSKLRPMMGGTFNTLTRHVTGLPYRDTQCGFKCFSREAARMLFSSLTKTRFAFDVELLWLARQMQLSVIELPVNWTDVEGSSVRVIRDSVRAALDVVTMLNGSRRKVDVVEFAIQGRDEEIDESLRVAAPTADDIITLRVGSGSARILVPFGVTHPEVVSELETLLSETSPSMRIDISTLQRREVTSLVAAMSTTGALR